MKTPSFLRKDLRCRTMIAGITFFRSSGFPFFTDTITISPDPALGSLFKRPPMLQTEMILRFFAPELSAQLTTAATGRPESWYKEAFAANPDALWVFGIDGPPHLSHIYRKNQKGEHLFKMMCLGKELGIEVEWKYIIFNYNEDYVEECEKLANDLGIRIWFIIPSRTLPKNLMPTKSEYNWRNYGN